MKQNIFQFFKYTYMFNSSNPSDESDELEPWKGINALKIKIIINIKQIK